MAEPRFTKGPWTHNADEEPACCRLSILKDGAPIAEVLNADDFPCLDEDDEQRVVEVDEQARADARLIAAAPDYDAAARAFVAHYTRGGGCSHCGGLPHTTDCFVGRFAAVLAQVDQGAASPSAGGGE